MGDEHDLELSHVREVHAVVDHLRRLLEAAAQAEEAGAAPLSEPRQSPPGR